MGDVALKWYVVLVDTRRGYVGGGSSSSIS